MILRALRLKFITGCPADRPEKKSTVRIVSLAMAGTRSSPRPSPGTSDDPRRDRSTRADRPDGLGPADTPRTPDSASSQRSSLGRGISSPMLNELDGAKDRRLGRSASRSNEPSRWTPTTRTTPRMPRRPSRSGDPDAATPGRVDDGQSRSPIARPEDVSDEVDALVTAAVDKGVGVAARTLGRRCHLRVRSRAGGRAADAMARALADRSSRG